MGDATCAALSPQFDEYVVEAPVHFIPDGMGGFVINPALDLGAMDVNAVMQLFLELANLVQ